MLDVKRIKKDYAIFQKQKDLIYLNSAATSLTPNSVIEAMSNYYRYNRSTIHRGSDKNVVETTKLYDAARQKIAVFIGSSVEEVIFTKSTTSSINRIAESISSLLNAGDEIIVSNLEHHSNYLPWLVLARKKKLKLVIVQARNKKIYEEDVLQKINSNTKVIALHHISNVLGDEVNIQKICYEAKKKNIITVIDGAQAVSHIKVDMKKIQPDFYTISAHKVFGPTGLGILYLNKGIANLIDPFDYGGDMVVASTVDYDSFTTKEAPDKFEAGTPPIAEVIGMGAAIDYIDKIGIENIHAYLLELKVYAKDKLQSLQEKVEVYNLDNNSNLITFNIPGVSVHDAVAESMLANITFGQEGISLRDGVHCNALTTKEVLGVSATLRASFQIYNSKEDIDKLIDTIEKIYDSWQGLKTDRRNYE